jgi:hypothetical protein
VQISKKLLNLTGKWFNISDVGQKVAEDVKSNPESGKFL